MTKREDKSEDGRNEYYKKKSESEGGRNTNDLKKN